MAETSPQVLGRSPREGRTPRPPGPQPAPTGTSEAYTALSVDLTWAQHFPRRLPEHTFARRRLISKPLGRDLIPRSRWTRPAGSVPTPPKRPEVQASPARRVESRHAHWAVSFVRV